MVVISRITYGITNFSVTYADAVFLRSMIDFALIKSVAKLAYRFLSLRTLNRFQYFQFSSIYIRDVTFTQEPIDVTFEDKYEVAFERVKLGENVNKIRIRVDNINASISSLFRIEESEFPGVDDITTSDINNDIFTLEAFNEQPEIVIDEKQCNFDYQGDILLRRNSFGFLRKEVKR